MIMTIMALNVPQRLDRRWKIAVAILASAAAGTSSAVSAAATAATNAIHRTTQTHPLARQVEVDNRSGESVQIDWVHPRTGELVPYGISDESGSTRISLQSFVNHTFAVRRVVVSGQDDQQQQQQQQRNESKSASATATTASVTVGSDGSQRVVGDAGSSPPPTVRYVTVGDPKEQLIIVKKDLEIDVVVDTSSLSSRSVDRTLEARNDAKSMTTSILERCKKERELATMLVESDAHREKVLNDLVDCYTKETAALLVVKNEVLAFERDIRRRIANQAENYTCADPNRITTSPIEVRSWTYREDELLPTTAVDKGTADVGTVRSVHILHDRPASKIHLIPNFISATECEAIRLAAEPLLHRGTVADGKGGSRMSNSRKAWQAGLETKRWDDVSDPIAAVKRRLYAYANHVTGYGMSLNGQEDVMSIQYFGNGTNDPTPDRYTPHCDGDCDSMEHKTGGRVATMVMYCDVPIVGGATNFQHANVYVKPTLHAGVFFSYMDNSTRIHDEGFTTHSGCPVVEGTKRIAVQWMRVGVNSSNPWNSFDTNTVPIGSKTRREDDDEED